jgi:hypothetical protein
MIVRGRTVGLLLWVRRGIMQSTALETLVSERDKLKAEIERLRNNIDGLEMATVLVRSSYGAARPRTRPHGALLPSWAAGGTDEAEAHSRCLWRRRF